MRFQRLRNFSPLLEESLGRTIPKTKDCWKIVMRGEATMLKLSD